MRNLGICASILAVSNIVAFTSPAFAQDTAKPSDEKASTSTTTPAKPADAPANDDALVAVHVESPVPVSLERRAPGGTTWENVCTTPCDVKTSSVSEYRITGTDLNDSKPFMIDGTKERVNLTVAPGSKARADAGLYILVAGGIVTVAGVAVMVLSSGKGDVFQSQNDGQTHGSYLNSMFFGGALVMVGLTAGIFGAGWMIGNKNSDVGGDVSKTIDEKPAPGGPGTPGGGGGAEVKFSTSSRQPTWNTQKNPGLPQVMSVPIFAGRF